MVRFPRRMLVLGAVVALTAGCLSPTLPLPPPSPVHTPPDQSGEIEISGYTDGGALIYAVNQRNREVRGQIAADDGRYDFKLPAKVGDDVSVYEQLGQKQSDAYEFVVK